MGPHAMPQSAAAQDAQLLSMEALEEVEAGLTYIALAQVLAIALGKPTRPAASLEKREEACKSMLDPASQV